MRTSRTDAQIAYNLADSMFRKAHRTARIKAKLIKANERYQRRIALIAALSKIRKENERIWTRVWADWR